MARLLQFNVVKAFAQRLAVFHALRVSAVCLVLIGCSSESEDNPFDVSGISAAGAKEPFSSTVYPEPDILTNDSPSTFQQASYQGMLQRVVFDSRTAEFSSVDAFIYVITFAEGYQLEAVVNSEFMSESNAGIEAEYFGRVLGQLPYVLRSEIEQIWIHKGRFLWGSVNKALYVHTGMSGDYQSAGIAEETLLHESVHIALDEKHENTPQWFAAQASDDNYISTYAKQNASSEDLAESFLMWMAARYRSESLSERNLLAILQSIPARVFYLDQQDFDMRPLQLDK